jgi:hypothetical protein
MELYSSIKSYRDWLAKMIPGFSGRIYRSATEKEIKWSSQFEGCFVPEAAFSLFMQLNGQKSNKIAFLPCPLRKYKGLCLESLEDAISARGNYGLVRKIIYRDRFPVFEFLDSRVRNAFWRDKWLPIAFTIKSNEPPEKNEAGIEFSRVACIFLDNNAVNPKQNGQVVYEECTDGFPRLNIRRTVIADSLKDYFDALLKMAENGELMYDPKIGIVWKIEGSLDQPVVRTELVTKTKTSAFSEKKWLALLRKYDKLFNSQPASGVSDSTLNKIEAAIGKPLPFLIKTTLRKFSCVSWPYEGYDHIMLLSAQELIQENNEPTDEIDVIIVSVTQSALVSPLYYSKDRLTFARSDYHRFQIDNLPAADGKAGQIVVVDIEEETIDWFCASLEDFFLLAQDSIAAEISGSQE